MSKWSTLRGGRQSRAYATAVDLDNQNKSWILTDYTRELFREAIPYSEINRMAEIVFLPRWQKLFVAAKRWKYGVPFVPKYGFILRVLKVQYLLNPEMDLLNQQYLLKWSSCLGLIKYLPYTISES